MSNRKIKHEELKYLAHKTVSAAIEQKKLVRQPCACCKAKPGNVWVIDAHHEDYSKPFDIVWLCRKHHMILHKATKDPKTREYVQIVVDMVRRKAGALV